MMITLLLTLWLAGPEAWASRPEVELQGPKSIYTPIISDLARGLAEGTPPGALNLALPAGQDIRVECLETPGQEFYVGIGQLIRINAPFEAVEAVMDDVASYQKLFPGFADVHLVSRQGDRQVTAWEQRIPVFFIPNAKYEMEYVITKPSTERKVWRYQLLRSKTVKVDDGLIMIERDGQATRFVEYDFWDAEWGVLKSLAPGRIWNDSLEGLVKTGLAIKLKAENPSKSNEWAHDEARDRVKALPLSDWIKHKKPFELLPKRAVANSSGKS
jgi:hypothetical protein